MDSSDDYVKLVDFGFARFYSGANGELMRTPCCTLNYAAPEVLHQAIVQSSHSSNLTKKDFATLYNTAGYDSSCDVSLHSVHLLLFRQPHTYLFAFLFLSCGVSVPFCTQCSQAALRSNLTH